MNKETQQTYSGEQIELSRHGKNTSYKIASENEPLEVKKETPTINIEQKYTKESYEADKLKLDLKEKEELLSMRKDWARFFRGIVVTILIFEVLITFMVGSNLLYFNDEWFLRIIISGGFAQILIMPFTLTKFLFNVESNLSKK